MLKPLIAATLLATTALAGAANPLTSRIFTADPAALVDNGRVYVYVGHDEAPVGATRDHSVTGAPERPRTLGKAPAGVPRATAPRRRRRSP